MKKDEELLLDEGIYPNYNVYPRDSNSSISLYSYLPKKDQDRQLIPTDSASDGPTYIFRERNFNFYFNPKQ